MICKKGQCQNRHSKLRISKKTEKYLSDQQLLHNTNSSSYLQSPSVSPIHTASPATFWHLTREVNVQSDTPTVQGK